MVKIPAITRNQKLAGVAAVAVVLVLIFSWAAYNDYSDNKSGESDTLVNVTFQTYEDHTGHSTVVKYYVGNKDVTGTTQRLAIGTAYTAVATSSAQIYMLSVNILPAGSNSIVDTTVRQFEASYNDSFSVDGTVPDFFGHDVTLSATVSLYNLSDTEYYVATTFHIPTGVTVTVGGQAVTDGQVLTLHKDTTMYIHTAKESGRLVATCQWSDGQGFSSGGTYEAEHGSATGAGITIDDAEVLGTAWYGNVTGSVTITLS